MKKLNLLFLVGGFLMAASTVSAQPYPTDCPSGGIVNQGATGLPGVFTPCDSGPSGTPQVYEAINHVFAEASVPFAALANNGAADSLAVNTDNRFWREIASGGASSNFAFIGITAGNMNSLGVYPKGDSSLVDFNIMKPQTGFGYLGDGKTNATAYPGATNPLSTQDFGFALKSVGAQDTHLWYSDPAENSDGFDHMLAYNLSALNGATVTIRLPGLDINDTSDDVFQTVTFSEQTYLLAFEDLEIAAVGGPSDKDYNDSIFVVTRVAPIPEPMSMILMGSGLAAMFGLRKRKKI